MNPLSKEKGKVLFSEDILLPSIQAPSQAPSTKPRSIRPWSFPAAAGSPRFYGRFGRAKTWAVGSTVAPNRGTSSATSSCGPTIRKHQIRSPIPRFLLRPPPIRRIAGIALVWGDIRIRCGKSRKSRASNAGNWVIWRRIVPMQPNESEKRPRQKHRPGNERANERKRRNRGSKRDERGK